MSLARARHGQTARLTLTGELTIYSVAETKAGLADAMRNADDLIHLAFIMLIFSGPKFTHDLAILTLKTSLKTSPSPSAARHDGLCTSPG